MERRINRRKRLPFIVALISGFVVYSSYINEMNSKYIMLWIIITIMWLVNGILGLRK